MGITRKTREIVYAKYNGHCAYCGQSIKLENMQVDHFVPKRAFNGGAEADHIENLMPSCRRCNHYKRAGSIEFFRRMLLEMKHKVMGTYLGKVAQDFGMVEWKGWDGKFYFERISASANEVADGGTQ